MTWGYIFEAKDRPPLDEQRTVLRALGVDTGAFGTCWHDRVDRISTRPTSQLVERAAMLAAIQPGDTVAFASPMCVGAGVKDVEWFLGELAARKVAVVVNGELARVEPGGDLSVIRDRFASKQNVLHVARSKRRARKV